MILYKFIRNLVDIIRRLECGFDVSEAELWQLVHSSDYKVRLRAITLGDLTSEMLDILANDFDSDVRFHVTHNSKTSDETLTELLGDPNIIIRAEASNSLFVRNHVAGGRQ